MNDIVSQPAVALARLLKARRLSATEVVRAHIARIEDVNPRLNAIVTFVPEQALAAAKAMDRKREKPGPLYGLPIAHKDLVPTKGVRTTYGSLLFRNEVPAENHAVVDRLAAAGAILVEAQKANWGPIQFDGELHDRATYRYFWELLQKARVTGVKMPEDAVRAFFD